MGAPDVAPLSLRLPAVPASVPRARLLIRDHLRVHADAEVVPDLELALCEAVTNVVRHAYPRSTGEVEIKVIAKPDAVEVIVRDQGVGVGASRNGQGPGFGLRVMAATARSLELKEVPGQGTEVRMSFPTPTRQ